MATHSLYGDDPTRKQQFGLLYASIACPFSHRVLAALSVTGLGPQLDLCWMDTVKPETGWMIAGGADPVFGKSTLHDVYAAAAPGAKSRPSVPLLIDPDTKRIVSSESSEITRTVSRGFDGSCTPRIDLCPTDLEPEISALNTWLHKMICRAVYRVGFATTQDGYDAEVTLLFNALDEMEQRLTGQSYLFGDQLTESDLYLFATLVRFDAVYGPLFKCSIRTIASYPALSRYLAELIAVPALARTVDLAETVHHYYGSVIHTKDGTRTLNASGVIPATPFKDYLFPGGQRLGARHRIVHSA